MCLNCLIFYLHFIFYNFIFLDDISDAPLTPDKRTITISASWENISQLANKSRMIENDSKEDIDKVEIIHEDEIFPDDFTAETVAKCLLKVSSESYRSFKFYKTTRFFIALFDF